MRRNTTSQVKRTPDLQLFPRIPIAQRRELPTCSAVYFVLDAQDVIIYIGATANMLQRWRQHDGLDRFGNLADTIAWQETPKDQLARLERLAISEHKPAFNRRLVSYPTCPKGGQASNLQLGDALRKWRIMSDKGIREVAEDIGISRGTLSNVERGEKMDAATLIKILLWLFS